MEKKVKNQKCCQKRGANYQLIADVLKDISKDDIEILELSFDRDDILKYLKKKQGA